ncbi:LysE family translocator [Aquimarina sp. AU474]|uniref:LysE family translocator n=1 Tax=Aquimarina sp. AU474 TaxID=2108529 RepID=UPI000D694F85|nr:LysE family transporter [Aquimarina sp. AU474]
MSIIEGFAIGLGMVIFVGPVFFLLLNSSFQSGTKAGIAVALGIIASDIVCVLLCYYGLSSIFNVEQNQFWIGVVGATIVLILGVNYLIKKANIQPKTTIDSRGVKAFFLKGFSVNFFNPFVFAIWIGIFNYGQHKYPTTPSLIGFLGFVLLGILATDLSKVFLSKKLKRFISVERLTVFFRITGVVLILFAIRLIYMVW